MKYAFTLTGLLTITSVLSMGVFSAPIPSAEAKAPSYLDVARHVGSGPVQPGLDKRFLPDAIVEVVKRDAHPPKGGNSNSCDGRTDPCTPAPYREYTGTTKSKRIISALPHSQSGMPAGFPIGTPLQKRSVSVDKVTVDEVGKREAHPPGPGNSCDGKPRPCTPAPVREYTGTTKKSINQHEALQIVSLPQSGVGRCVGKTSIAPR